MIYIFHGTDKKTHNQFQAWRQANTDGYHMTEKSAGTFTIHYAQDKRENPNGRGCNHQGCSWIKYGETSHGGCYTTARKVCSNNFSELISWAKSQGFSTKNCQHCDTKRFPFPSPVPELVSLPDELTKSVELVEGAVCQVTVNAYERNPVARAHCIKHYGPTCVVCGISFGDTYGPLAEGFIHVHHIKPLSKIGEKYIVDPVADLRPVCPNCHAVIHLGGECRSIDEVRNLLKIGKTAIRRK